MSLQNVSLTFLVNSAKWDLNCSLKHIRSRDVASSESVMKEELLLCEVKNHSYRVQTSVVVGTAKEKEY